MPDASESGHRLTSWADMRSDLAALAFDEMSSWEKFKMWVTYYWRPTRRWVPSVSMWWHYEVLRYPKRPPFQEDPVARHLGLVDGVPPCTDGLRCADHGLMTHGR